MAYLHKNDLSQNATAVKTKMLAQAITTQFEVQTGPCARAGSTLGRRADKRRPYEQPV